MNILFIGDVVGRRGREAVLDHLPDLQTSLQLDFVIVNGENAAGGFGITSKICQEFFDAGVDVISTGNHVWDQRETLSFIDNEHRLLRPVNFPAQTPGRGSWLYESDKGRVLVVNAMGRVFMDPLDDPFAAVGDQIDQCRLGLDADAVVIDFHGEATSEKMAMGHFADGRASLVVGTHSHVPTADAQILPGGTAYQTDAGACADYDSVIGMEKDEPLHRFTNKMASGRFTPAMGEATLCGVFVATDPKTGLARQVAPVRVGGRLQETLPSLDAGG